ncbi:MAG TPA: DUF2332 family protein [Roseomonas sp.]|nr:DUF2332 family protein [Roseomonas sp.]
MEAWTLSSRAVLPRSRKARALLAILGMALGQPVPRSRLAELLWSRRGEEQQRGSLPQALHELQAILGGIGTPEARRCCNPGGGLPSAAERGGLGGCAGRAAQRCRAGGAYDLLLRAIPAIHRLARHASALDPMDAQALTSHGHVRAFLQHQMQEGAELHARALALNPNLAMAWVFSGMAESYPGRHEAALAQFDRYAALSPCHPHAFFDAGRSIPLLMLRRHAEAAAVGRACVALRPGFSYPYKTYLSALGHLGERAEAARLRDPLLEIEPDFSVAKVPRCTPVRGEADRAHYAGAFGWRGWTEASGAVIGPPFAAGGKGFHPSGTQQSPEPRGWAAILNHERFSSLSERYHRFAREEAAGRSPLYEALAHGIAEDEDVLAFLSGLPESKQQPNLLLAAVRHLFGLQEDVAQFRATLLAHAEAVRSVMETRSTQTNEPARCAVLLPILARLPQPLALIEVGASAGLCLLPDRYGYDYGGRELRPPADEAAYPVFRCAVSDATPVPAALPRVIWRAGLDLNPLDATDSSEAAWLESLVWPGQAERLRNLRAALRVAADAKPRQVRGDLSGDDLPALCREAPKEATLVIFHTAVLSYVANPSDRQAFAERASSLSRYWICNEAPRVFPEIAGRAARPGAPGLFLLSVNGRPVGWTDPHGASLEWIAGREAF